MILEVATLDVKEGQTEAFERTFAEAQKIIASMPGYLSHQLQQCIEEPGRYVLLVDWETLEDHTVGFRGSESYQRWRELLHHFYDPFPTVQHFKAIPASTALPGNVITGFSPFAGEFSGRGEWTDSAGGSAAYAIIQTNTLTGDGFRVQFEHHFDEGDVVKADFVMAWTGKELFRVTSAGASIGNGYLLRGYCHYHLEVGGAFVESSYQVRGDGLQVFGSSSKNADGNYIAWSESLTRISNDDLTKG